MIPDARRRTIKIPVRIDGDRVLPLDGDSIPALKDGANGTLVIEASELKDIKLARDLTAETVVPVLPAGSKVYFGISQAMIEDESRFNLIPPNPYSATFPYCLAEGVLEEELSVVARKNKTPTLLGCRCSVPALGISAFSLNQALTQISTMVETRRTSHTGSVFRRVFVYDGEFQVLLWNVCQDRIDSALRTP